MFRRIALAVAALLWAAVAYAQAPGMAGLQATNWYGGAGIASPVQVPTPGHGYAIGDTITLYCPGANFSTFPTVNVASLTTNAGIKSVTVTGTGVMSYGTPVQQCTQYATTGSGGGSAFTVQLGYLSAGTFGPTGSPLVSVGAVGGVVPIANGGCGATSAIMCRQALGVNLFNVDTDFGAVGDGVTGLPYPTDNATAFANALAACGAFGGGRVVVGPHQYYIGTTPVVPANCSLEGDAPALSYSANNSDFWQTQPYELLLGPGVTINVGAGTTPDQGSSVKNLAIVSAGMTPNIYSAPNHVQLALARVAAFNGTAITIPHTSQGSKIDNVVIAGFNLAIDNESAQTRIHSVHGDNTNGLLTNYASDETFNDDISWNAILSAVGTQEFQYLDVTAITNDGTGQAQVTVSTTTADIANGNTVYMDGLTNRADLIGAWTVGNLSVGGSSTTFSLVGSSFGASTFTGNLTNQSYYLTNVSTFASGSPGKLGFLAGMPLSDNTTANCLQAGTTIAWINLDADEAYLSQPAQCSASGDTITATPAAYSGTTVHGAVLNAGYRSGYGFKVGGNSQGVMFSNVFDWGHAIAFDISSSSTWAQFVNFQCDGDAYTQEPTRICINIEGTGSMATFTSGTILDAAITVKVNTTGGVSGPSFPNIIDDTTIYNNKYMGFEALSGGVMFGSGVNFRSVYPNFVGDGASIQSLAHNAQTFNPQTIYQSAADTANVNFPLVGNFSTTGNAAIGGTLGVGSGETSPTTPIQVLSTADAVPGIRVDDVTSGSASNLTVAPTTVTMNRTAGSGAGFTIATADAGGWGAAIGAGSIVVAPNAAPTVAFYTDGLTVPSRVQTISGLTGISCVTSIRGAWAYVVDTVSSAAVVWGNQVLGGGSTSVESYAHCNAASGHWVWGM